MGQKKGPICHAAWDSTQLPIYCCPVKIRPNSQNTPVTYDSFEIVYRENGKRHIARARTLSDAKIKGKRIAKRLAQEGSQLIELSQADRRIYVTSKEILRPHGLVVDSAARMIDDLLTRLAGTSLQQAVDFFNAYGKRVIAGTTGKEAYDVYLAALERRGVGAYHLRDVKKFVGAFVEAFPAEIAGVRTKQIDDHIAKRGGKARNKNNCRDRIIAFFNFMEQKDYLPKGIEHAAKGTTAFADRRPVITSEEDAAASVTQTDIYMPDEMGLMLGVAEQDERVTVELKGFSGIRTEELGRLWWVLIDEGDGKISLPVAIAKLNQRTIPIGENLKRRLRLYPKTEKRDKVCKRWGSANALYHVWKRIADRAGVPYKKNGFRNSYISYRLAQTNDIKLVAEESGNSPEMIRKYYLGLTTPDQAQRWFSL
jgi:hypothetical protein